LGGRTKRTVCVCNGRSSCPCMRARAWVQHRSESIQKAVEEMQRFYSACTYFHLNSLSLTSQDVACLYHGEGSTHRNPDKVETTISQPPPLATGKEQGSTKKGKSKKEKNQKGACTTLSGNSLPHSGDDAVLRIISCQSLVSRHGWLFLNCEALVTS
jgi:hypothetical protein